MELLRALFPGRVNAIVRHAVREYCAKLRERGLGARGVPEGLDDLD